MTRKAKAAKVPREDNLQDTKELNEGRERAQLALHPAANAAGVVESYGKAPFSAPKANELAIVLVDSFNKLEKGSMAQCEAMLFGQANALQSIFTSLARRAICQEQLLQYETHLRLALKAQNQCRATLETLAAIKNPPVVFAKQANIAAGPQQVNNGVDPSRAGKNEIEQSKLSGGNHELLPDTRASQAESRIDPPVGAVEEFDRAEVGGG
jgi:hypothetical protein